MLTRIYINQHKIRENQIYGSNVPPITIKTYKSKKHAHELEILGPAKIIYSPTKPLSCGARCWIETNSEIRINKRS